MKEFAVAHPYLTAVSLCFCVVSLFDYALCFYKIKALSDLAKQKAKETDGGK